MVKQIIEEEENKVDPNISKNPKKARIVIRNLVFDVNESHVRKLFSKYGNILDIQLPINPSTNKARGFAFVQFEKTSSCLKAIKELNATQFKGRQILIDISIAKLKYQSSNSQGPIIQPSATQREDLPEQHENKPKKKHSSKEEIQNTKQKPENNQKDQKSKNQNDSKDQKQQKDAKNNKESKRDNSTKDHKDSKENGKKISKEIKITETEFKIGELKQPKKQPKETPKIKIQTETEIEPQPTQAQEDMSKTLFVKNISYETEEEDFKRFFFQFGKVQYGRLVIDREKGLKKGTGFIKFVDAKDAETVLERFSQSEMDFELNGRVMLIQAAENKESIQQKAKAQQNLPEDKKKVNMKKLRTLDSVITTDKNNKRKLAYSRLGLNKPEDWMSELETRRREDNISEKLEKFKNPNMFVSTTRVMIKYLAKEIKEEELKEFFGSILKGLYPDRVNKTRFISQIKVVYDKLKIDENGNPKSSGLAFVQFTDEEFCLKVLEQIQESEQEVYRQLNSKPIIELCVDDARTLQKREQIKQSQQSQRVFKPKEDDDQGKKEKSEVRKSHNLATKLIIEKIIESKSEKEKGKAYSLLDSLKSRGIKQRMKKKLDKTFGVVEQVKEKPQNGGEANTEKQQQWKVKNTENQVVTKQDKKKKVNFQVVEKEQQVNQKKKEKKQKQTPKHIEQEEIIKQEIQTKKKDKKRKVMEAIKGDDFDDIVQKYEKQQEKKKKIAWDSNQ